MILSYLVPILIILILILLNGLFVAAEFAIVTAPRSIMVKYAEKGSKSAKKIVEILSSPDLQNKYITTAQVGITVASLGLGMYGEHAIADWILEPLSRIGSLGETLTHSISIILAVGILTYLHVVLGEMIPKSFALQTASSTIIALYTPLNIAQRLFFPIVYSLNHLSIWLVKNLKFPELETAEHATRLFTPEDIEYIVEESLTGGLLEANDQLFIENILDLDERTAGQVITPRNRLIAIPLQATQDEILKIIMETNKTRYPVFDRNLDQIIGVLHIKDLVRWQLLNPDNILVFSELIRPVIYIPDTLPLNQLLLRFQNEQIQFAVALDEYGGTAGIITLEDLVEEVVGEILDEFDEETTPIVELPGGVLRVRGDVILAELEQLYDLDWDEDVETYSIGGYMMSMLGHIPAPQDTVSFGKITITVEEVDGLAVKSVLIILP